MEWDLALMLVISIFNLFYTVVALAYDLARKSDENWGKMFAFLIIGLTALFFYLISM